MQHQASISVAGGTGAIPAPNKPCLPTPTGHRGCHHACAWRSGGRGDKTLSGGGPQWGLASLHQAEHHLHSHPWWPPSLLPPPPPHSSDWSLCPLPESAHPTCGPLPMLNPLPRAHSKVSLLPMSSNPHLPPGSPPLPLPKSSYQATPTHAPRSHWPAPPSQASRVAPGPGPLSLAPGVAQADHVQLLRLEKGQQAMAQAHLAHIGDGVCMAFHQATCQAGLHVRRCQGLRRSRLLRETGPGQAPAEPGATAPPTEQGEDGRPTQFCKLGITTLA